MLTLYRSSVNRWECDENDHLNVRFYVAKHLEVLEAGLMVSGMAPAQGAYAVQTQHLRFLAEARIATPIKGDFCVLAESSNAAMRCLTELRHGTTDEVLSTCVHVLETTSVLNNVPTVAELPVYAQARGVSEDVPDYIEFSLPKATRAGFQMIGAGVVQPQEVAPSGGLLLHQYMGRLSDSMPHLWAYLGAHSGLSAEDENNFALEGGAVLEYRLRYHANLHLGARFEIHSGLLTAGGKVQSFAHLIFDTMHDELVASAEACAVRMDLQARKAIQLSPERVAKMKLLELEL